MLIMSAFFSFQFPYCPRAVDVLQWIFCSRELNRKINRLHERCLLTVYLDMTSLFEKSLQKDNSVSKTHLTRSHNTPYIQVLAKELFRVYKGISPKIMT